VLVDYAPAAARPGTHPTSTVIRAAVLEGAIGSPVNDGPATTCKAGESWSELPGDRHRVSTSASDPEPARLLAVFIVDINDTALTTHSGTE
jgi:quercetin dioxygenase-like cupin family protein